MVQSLCITYEPRRKMSKWRSDYWFMTWAEKPSPSSCGLVVPIEVSRIHHTHVITHKEFIENWILYALGPCVSDSSELDIPLLVPQVRSSLGTSFQPRSRINNFFVTSTFSYGARTQYVVFLPNKSDHFSIPTKKHKKLSMLREPITPLSTNHITQIPKEPQS